MFHGSSTTKPASEQAQRQGLLGALLAGTAIVYLPTLWYGFLYDDLPTIVQYIHIRSLDFKNHFFGNSRWVSRILNQITYYFGGVEPFAYRTIDLAMHLATGVMVFAIANYICKKQTESSLLHTHSTLFPSLVTALFLLHPVQTQTVTYVTQMRLEGLVAFFSCAVILLFIRAMSTASSTTRMVLLGASLALASVAAGTKEIIVALPVLLILTDLFFVSGWNWKSLRNNLWIHTLYTGIIVLLLAKFGVATPGNIGHMTTAVLDNHRGNILTSSAAQPITPLLFFASQGKVLLHYISIFFFPVNLSFDYDMKLAQSLFGVDVLIPWLLLGLLCFGLVRLLVKNQTNVVVFGFAWFFAAMLPRTSFIPSTELICDYKTYLASIGICFVLAYLLLQIINLASVACDHMIHFSRSRTAAWAFTLLCFGMSYATWQRNKVWSTEELFWKDVIEKSPNKARAHNNYGTCRWEKNDVALALKHFEKAIELDNHYGEPHVNKAAIHQTLARSTQDQQERATQRALAFSHYEKALDIGEMHYQMFNNLGLFHLDDNNKEAAEQCFLKSLEINPVYSAAHKNLAKIYQETGNRDAAAKHFAAAMRGDEPNDFEALFLAANNAYESGDHAKAQTLLEPLAATGHEQVLFLLGCCAYARHQYDAACAYFDQACMQDKENYEYRYNYGQALMASNRFADAYAVFDSCLQHSDKLPYIPLHVAKCLVNMGHRDEAKMTADILVEHSPLESIRRDALAFKQEYNLIDKAAPKTPKARKA